MRTQVRENKRTAHCQGVYVPCGWILEPFVRMQSSIDKRNFTVAGFDVSCCLAGQKDIDYRAKSWIPVRNLNTGGIDKVRAGVIFPCRSERKMELMYFSPGRPDVLEGVNGRSDAG
jgi:hypothetical protein